ncbi:hypothetical protein CUC08_Gglean001508 [Alternaria sp. MG1]|nr:hypothetical protein CUC08_Gglean001508 [Alternaria sp. MG1]
MIISKYRKKKPRLLHNHLSTSRSTTALYAILFYFLLLDYGPGNPISSLLSSTTRPYSNNNLKNQTSKSTFLNTLSCHSELLFAITLAFLSPSLSPLPPFFPPSASLLSAFPSPSSSNTFAPENHLTRSRCSSPRRDRGM